MPLPYANLQTRLWNPGATQPLILPLTVVCNTSDEDIYNNIKANSRRPGEWLKLADPHDGIAILCGSGPSINDDLDAIAEWRDKGATIFAMNGCAAHLASRGILPDYQIILDARKETASLVGPAKAHLFASQVHPACFDRMPSAKVWHLQVEGIDDLLPLDSYSDGYVLVGGAASVGNTSTCLAYAMGFRRLEIYGFDSSFRDDASHAFRQPMNDGDANCWVGFNGKEYYVSLTMKLQAEKFQETAAALKEAGVTINVHGTGLLPDMYNTPVENLPEREKYERMWCFAAYRTRAPGEECAEEFIDIVRPSGTVIDFGCGTGRASLKFKEAGLEPILIDFASNCRDHEARTLPFFEFDLRELIPIRANYGFCTDVMEHIAPDQVDIVISNIMMASETVYFQISTREDNAGFLINQKLHLTVRPHSWWLSLFEDAGYAVIFAREEDDSSIFIVSRKAVQ